MSAVAAGMLAGGSAVCAVVGVRRIGVDGLRRRGSGAFVRWAWGRSLERSLVRAGIGIGVDGAVAITALTAVLAALTAWWLLCSPVAAVILAVVVVTGASSVVASADRRYVQRVVAQLPLIAQQLAGGVGAGLSLRQALERAAADLPEPARGEMGAVAAELRLGVRVEHALDHLVDRVGSGGLELLVAAVVVQRAVGGDLAHALSQLAGQLEERDQLARESRGATAQARMSAWLVAALPAVAGLAVEVAAPGTLQQTLGQGPGRLLLVVAVALEAAGVVLVRRIVADRGGDSCRVR